MELERKESVDWQVVSEKCFAQKTCQCDRDHGCEVVRAAMARETVANLLRQYDDSTAAYNQLRTINAGLQDENDTLRADLRSATASYRKALDAADIPQVTDRERLQQLARLWDERAELNWQLSRQLEDAIPNAAIAYNARGAAYQMCAGDLRNVLSTEMIGDVPVQRIGE